MFLRKVYFLASPIVVVFLKKNLAKKAIAAAKPKKMSTYLKIFEI